VPTIPTSHLVTIALLALSVTPPHASARSDAQRPTAKQTDHQVAAGTYLEIELRTSLSSNTSNAGDPVDGRLRLPLTSADGVELVPAGATVLGTVSEAEPAGKKLRGRLVFAFHVIKHPETGSLATIKARPLTFVSDPPKKGNLYQEVKLEKGFETSVSLTAPLVVRISSAK
jgi:hypothetical protein